MELHAFVQCRVSDWRPCHCSFATSTVVLPLVLSSLWALALQQQVGAAALHAGNYLVASNFIYEIDRLTGDRQILLQPSAELGPNFGYGGGVAIDSNWNIYFANVDAEAIYRFDPDTDAVTVVSGAVEGGIVGSGLELDFPIGLVLGPKGELLVADRDLRAVLSIDPSTGNRTVISGGPDNIGQGADPFQPHDLLLTPEGALLVGGGGMNAILNVDLDSGDRVPITRSGPNPIGSGPDFTTGSRLSPGPAGTILMTAGFPHPDPGLGVLQVNLVTGDRSILYVDQLGRVPSDTYHEADGNLLILYRGRGGFEGGSIRRIDPSTGAIEYFSYSPLRPPYNPLIGEGPPLFDPNFIVQIPVRVPEPAMWAFAVPLMTIVVSRRRRAALN